MKKKNGLYLVAAVFLLLIGSLLTLDPEPTSRIEITRPKFRKRASKRELKREQMRKMDLKTLFEGKLEKRKKDPLKVALSATKSKDFMIVVELAELVETEIGEMVALCFSGNDKLKNIEEEIGVDPFESIKRIAVTDQGVFLDGDLERMEDKMKDEGDDELEMYGENGVLLSSKKNNASFAVWNKNMFIYSPKKAQVTSVVDILEGKAPEGEELYEDEDAYGHIYGHIKGKLLKKLFKKGDNKIVSKVAEVVDSFKFNIEADDNVVIVAKATGKNNEELDDLALMIGSAISLYRMKSEASGDEKLAQLLSYTTIKRESGEFTVEVALPKAEVMEILSECGKKD